MDDGLSWDDLSTSPTEETSPSSAPVSDAPPDPVIAGVTKAITAAGQKMVASGKKTQSEAEQWMQDQINLAVNARNSPDQGPASGPQPKKGKEASGEDLNWDDLSTAPTGKGKKAPSWDDLQSTQKPSDLYAIDPDALGRGGAPALYQPPQSWGGQVLASPVARPEAVQQAKPEPPFGEQVAADVGAVARFTPFGQLNQAYHDLTNPAPSPFNDVAPGEVPFAGGVIPTLRQNTPQDDFLEDSTPEIPSDATPVAPAAGGMTDLQKAVHASDLQERQNALVNHAIDQVKLGKMTSAEGEQFLIDAGIDKRKVVGFDEMVKRSFLGAGAGLSKIIAGAGGALAYPITAADAAIAGKPVPSPAEAVSAAEEPYQRAQEAQGLKSNERVELPGQLGAAVGQIGMDLPAMFATGAAMPVAQGVKAVAQTFPQVAEEIAGHLLRTFGVTSPVMARDVEEELRRRIQAGETPTEAAAAGAKMISDMTLQNAVFGGVKGGMLARAVKGGALGAATAGTTDPTQVGIQTLTGMGFGAAMGEEARAPDTKTRYRELAQQLRENAPADTSAISTNPLDYGESNAQPIRGDQGVVPEEVRQAGNAPGGGGTEEGGEAGGNDVQRPPPGGRGPGDTGEQVTRRELMDRWQNAASDTERRAAANDIANYDAQHPVGEKTPPEPETITTAMRQELFNSGYDHDEIDKMSPDDAWNAIDELRAVKAKNNLTSPDQAESVLTQAKNFGARGWAKLRNLVDLSDSEDPNQKGELAPGGKPTVYVNNVTPEDLPGKVVHEVAHANEENLRPDKAEADQDASALLRIGKSDPSGKVQAQINLIPKGTAPEAYNREVLANVLEGNFHNSTIQRVLDRFTIKLNRLGVPKTWLDANPALVREMAVNAIRNYGEERPTQHSYTPYQPFTKPKLTPEQAAAKPWQSLYSRQEQQQSPEFQKYYGGPREDDGSPKILYHGTGESFDAFEHSLSPDGDIGMHLGTEGQANDRVSYLHKDRPEGQNLMPVYANIRNPIRLRDEGSFSLNEIRSQLKEHFPQDADKIDALDTSAQARSYLESKGHDGVVYKNMGETAGGQEVEAAHTRALNAMIEERNKAAPSPSYGTPEYTAWNRERMATPEYKAWKQAASDLAKHREANAEDSYIALRPEQIKSATGNRGTFDPNNPNILQSRVEDRFTSPEDRGGFGRGGEVADNERWQSGARAGQYIGAPAKYNTPAKIPALRRMLRALALEGESGKRWYEDSGKAILRHTGGDIGEARKLAKVLAIYSPQAKVDANTTMALHAWEQYKAGQPIQTKTEVQDRYASRVLYGDGVFEGGEKTNNFYNNLMRHVDPEAHAKQGATIDMWMMRAAGYHTDSPTDANYRFVENEVNRLGQQLGWSPEEVQAAIWVAMKARTENPGVKARTEEESTRRGYMRYETNAKGKQVRNVLNEPAHRDVWFKHAMAFEPGPEDTRGAAYDFGHALDERAAQLSHEAIPSVESGVLPGIHNAPMDQKIEYHRAIQDALRDPDGRDAIDKVVGPFAGRGKEGFSGWEGKSTVGEQTPMPVYTKGGRVGDASRKLIDLNQAVRGQLLNQKAMAWHYPIYGGPKFAENGAEVTLGRHLTEAENAALYKDISEQLGHTMAPPIPTVDGRGFRVLNFPEISGAKEMTPNKLKSETRKANEGFHHAIEVAVAKQPWHNEVSDHVRFQSDGNFISSEAEHGPANYGSRIAATAAELQKARPRSWAGRPDIQDWVENDLRPRVDAVNADFAKRYGWDKPTAEGGVEPLASRLESRVEGKPHIKLKAEQPRPEAMDTFGNANARRNEDRETRGEAPLSSTLSFNPKQVIEEARANYSHAAGEALTNEVLNNPRAMTPHEEATLLLHGANLRRSLDDVHDNIDAAKASGNFHARTSAEIQRRETQAQLDANDRAVRMTGTVWSGAGQIRQQLADHDMNIANVLRSFESIGDVSPQLKQRVENIVREVRKSAPRAPKDQLNDLAKQFANAFKKPAGLQARLEDPDQAATLRKMAKIITDGGETDPAKVIDQIHELVKDTGVAKGDIADTLSKPARRTKAEELSNYQKLQAELKDLNRVQEKYGTPESRQLEEAKRKRLTAQIADLDKRIAAGDTSKRGKMQGPEEFSTVALRNARDAKARELANMEPSPPAIYPEDPAVRRNANRQREIARQMADIRGRIQRGDFENAPKLKIPYNDETMRHQRALDNARGQLAQLRAMHERQQQGIVSRVADLWHNFHMMNILSSIMVYPKLAAAVVGQHVVSHTNDFVASVARHIPGLSNIYKMAPRHGQGWQAAAEREAYTKGMSAAAKGAWEQLKYGQSDIERQWADHKMTAEFTDFAGSMANAMTAPTAVGRFMERARVLSSYVGRTHAAVKEGITQPEFYKSLAKRQIAMARDLKEQGWDPGRIQNHLSKESTMAELSMKAMNDAFESKMQGKNVMADSINDFLVGLERRGEGGRLASFIFKSIFPIRKVPLNIAKELSSYSIGGLKAAGSLAFGKGDMTEARAEYIAKNINKQGTGLALMAIGYLGGKAMFGGVPGAEKRDKNAEVAPGEGNIFGLGLGSEAFHGAPAMMLQVGASFRSIWENEHGADDRSIENGLKSFAKSAGTAIGRTVPYIDQPRRMENTAYFAGKEGRSGADAIVGNQLRSMLIPNALQQIARYTDPDQIEYRHPRNIAEDLETGIPGLRANVPESAPYKPKHQKR